MGARAQGNHSPCAPSIHMSDNLSRSNIVFYTNWSSRYLLLSNMIFHTTQLLDSITLIIYFRHKGSWLVSYYSTKGMLATRTTNLQLVLSIYTWQQYICTHSKLPVYVEQIKALWNTNGMIHARLKLNQAKIK